MAMSLWTKRNKGWLIIVPFGTLFIFALMLSRPILSDESTTGVKTVQIQDKSAPSSPQPEKIRAAIRRLGDVGMRRSMLHKRRNSLMKEMGKARRGANFDKPGLRQFFFKRGFEKKASDLHLVLEEERELSIEQRLLLRKLLENKTLTNDLINEEIASIEKAGKPSAGDKKTAAQDNKFRAARRIESLRQIREALDYLEKNPRQPAPAEKISKTEETAQTAGAPQPRSPRPRSRMRARPETGDEKEWAQNFVGQKMRRLQNQMQELRINLERSQREMEDLKRIIKTLRERRPEIFEEIEKEGREQKINPESEKKN